MVRTIVLSWYLLGAASAACMTPTMAEEAASCSHFTWNVAHELEVMKQAATPITAASKPGSQVPQIQVDKLYELKLAAQSAVTYSVPFARTSDPSSVGGGTASPARAVD